ncbi:hypothetical protein [Methylocapsa palsarum]|uniref:Uncharacterized protein n=1 Tax=Methylocapsa palsarum TaxID=1612308 RepID=A0A1I3XE57_9HYPH|nr:hypothetical protein [Methylocapsa palsarum]SFK17782.1 hypothetical protein SAMN05444581_10359 [Methylocapsa palsarum]
MSPEIFALALAAISGGPAEWPGLSEAGAPGGASGIGAVAGEVLQQPPPAAALPVFRPADRSVSNWKAQSADNLTFPHDAALADDVPNVPRCVKLNNYWCVKRAGWTGELAADAEGHVAFASASEGAIVAAMLLRRYYLNYGLHSAKAILSRWAPAQCESAVFLGNRAKAQRNVSKTASLTWIATRGIGNTLRARWLASHRPGFTGSRAASAEKPANKTASTFYRSRVPTRTVSLMRAPEIAVGMGERALDHAPIKIELFDSPGPPETRGAPCPSEGQRLLNYAIRAIEGLASSPDEDLNLFSRDGTPGTNLPLLMRNMAGVEIGPLSVRKDLIDQAVALEAARTAALQAPAPPPP